MLPCVAYFSLLFFARLTVVVVDFLPLVGKMVSCSGCGVTVIVGMIS